MAILYTIPVELFGGFAGLLTVPLLNKLCQLGFQARSVAAFNNLTAALRQNVAPVLFEGNSDSSSCDNISSPEAAIVAEEVSAGRGIGASKSLNSKLYHINQPYRKYMLTKAEPKTREVVRGIGTQHDEQCLSTAEDAFGYTLPKTSVELLFFRVYSYY